LLVDDSDSQEITYAEREELSGRKRVLAHAMNTLRERERHIIVERRLKDRPTTLDELAPQYSISRERQIEVRALGKLQKAMRTRIAARGRHALNAQIYDPLRQNGPD